MELTERRDRKEKWCVQYCRIIAISLMWYCITYLVLVGCSWFPWSNWSTWRRWTGWGRRIWWCWCEKNIVHLICHKIMFVVNNYWILFILLTTSQGMKGLPGMTGETGPEVRIVKHIWLTLICTWPNFSFSWTHGVESFCAVCPVPSFNAFWFIIVGAWRSSWCSRIKGNGVDLARLW